MSEKSYANRLYPDGYSFDWEVFLSDPEGYKFTAEDIAFLNAKDLEKVESETPMNLAEKRILRKWVRDGNSPYSNPGSKYLCLSEPESLDFLTVYRMDCELEAAMKGMSKAEKESYLKEYLGWVDET